MLDLRRSLRLALLVPIVAAVPAVGAQQLGWNQLSSANRPPAVRDPAVVFDENRAVLLTFGGELASGLRSRELWEWNGNDWTRRSTTGPASRVSARFACDSVNQSSLLFGGLDGTTVFGDTWAWNGVRWSRQSPSASPPARYDHGMVFDAGRGRVVLFGGFDNVADLADTWEWDGATWAQIATAASPPPRRDLALTYDPLRGEIVMFGGRDVLTAFDDTWVFDGSMWTQRAPAVAPPPRAGGTMAFDAARGVVVLFGGVSVGGVRLADTWEWDGTTWTEVAAQQSPSPRTDHGMGFDPAGVMLVFGGSGPPVLDETWSFGSVGTQIGAYEIFGTSCPGSGGVPELVPTGVRPLIGERILIGARSLPVCADLILIYGASRTRWLGRVLPIELGILGAPGCSLYVSVDLTLPPRAVQRTTTFPYTIPNDPRLVGTTIYNQALILDHGAPNALGATFTNGLAIRIGQ